MVWDGLVKGELNSERIEYYLKKSRNNIDSDTVMLGRTGTGNLITQNEGYTYNPNAGCYFSDGTKQFYQREIDYIISKGYTFETTNDGFWRAIKK